MNLTEKAQEALAQAEIAERAASRTRTNDDAAIVVAASNLAVAHTLRALVYELAATREALTSKPQQP